MLIFLEGGAYDDAHMPNWPYRYHIPLPGMASPGLHQSKGESFVAGNLSTSIFHCLLGCADGVTILSLFWILGLSVSDCHMSLK